MTVTLLETEITVTHFGILFAGNNSIGVLNHASTDFGDDSEGSEFVADTGNVLKNGKFLLIGSGARKKEFFELCFPGFNIFIMIFDDLEIAVLRRSNLYHWQMRYRRLQKVFVHNITADFVHDF